MALAAPEDPHWFLCLRDLQGVHADVGATGASSSNTFRPSADSKNRLMLWHHKGATGRRRHRNKKNGTWGTLRCSGLAELRGGGLCGEVWPLWPRDVHLLPDHLTVALPPQSGPCLTESGEKQCSPKENQWVKNNIIHCEVLQSFFF